MTEAEQIVQGLTVQNCAARAKAWLDAWLPAHPYPAEQFAGRGVVTCAGGIKYGVPAWVMIRALRHVGCTLPVELWHRGPAERIPALVELMAPLDVTWVDAFEVQREHPHARLNGFEMKPYAIQWSRFAEVIFLDADNVPIVDPTFLLDSPQYAAAGTILWPDYHRLARSRAAWQIWDLPYRDEPEVESGQIVVNKSRAWPCFWLADWYGQRSLFTWRHVHGDKELFHLCWRKLGEYAMTPHKIRTLTNEQRRHRTMLQHDFDGRRIFQHHNTRKWSLSEPWEHIPGFDLLGEVRGWLDELRAIWNPATGDFATAADRDAQQQYAGRAYEYTRYRADGVTPRDSRRLVLGQDGLIAEGAAGCEVYWSVRDDRLRIAGRDGRLTMELDIAPGGRWLGRWLVHERMRVRLTPA